MRALGCDADEFSDQACVAEIAWRTSRVMAPFWMMRMRCESAAMKSRFCSTRIMVSPLLARSRCKVSTISSMIEGWMPSVGSSSRTRRGLPQRQRAIARSCCSPPDSAPPDALEQRLQARKLLQHGCDGVVLGCRLLGAAHAQIVVDA